MFGKASKFRKVLRASRIPAREAMSIDDELRDYEAARAVGLAFGAVTWGYTRPDVLRALDPAVTFGSVEEIPFKLEAVQDAARARSGTERSA
jgi:phosphoglycolate phosphatase